MFWVKYYCPNERCWKEAGGPFQFQTAISQALIFQIPNYPSAVLDAQGIIVWSADL